MVLCGECEAFGSSGLLQSLCELHSGPETESGPVHGGVHRKCFERSHRAAVLLSQDALGERTDFSLSNSQFDPQDTNVDNYSLHGNINTHRMTAK